MKRNFSFGSGRPPMYDNAEDLQEKILDYFANGITTKSVIVGKAPNNRVVEIEVPTITGLVLHCGFADRSSFYKYEEKDEFRHTIKKARTFIETHYEEMLQTGNTIGALFALKNFGWTDRLETKLIGDKEKPVTIVSLGAGIKPKK